jgi:hypothetical protein
VPAPASADVLALLDRSPGRSILGLVVCLVIPMASWAIDGRGRWAFTMYSTTVTYRVDIASLDDQGTRHALAPTAIAGEVSFDSAAPFLAGADDWRTVAQVDALRAHLGDVARAACRVGRGSEVEITLHERASPASALDEEAPVHRTTERVACRPSP